MPHGLLGFGLGLLLSLAPGCKGSKGEVCRCADDCRDGLVCLVGATTVLEPGECGPSTQIGHCVDDESLSQLEGGLGDMPIFDDLPSKRDLGAGETTATDSGTDTTSTDTSSTDSSSTDTSTDTSSTDTSTDTSSTDTGTSDSSSSDSSSSDSSGSDSSTT